MRFRGEICPTKGSIKKSPLLRKFRKSSRISSSGSTAVLSTLQCRRQSQKRLQPMIQTPPRLDRWLKVIDRYRPSPLKRGNPGDSPFWAPEKKTFDLKFDLKPKEVKQYLDRYVIKQDDAKKALAIAVCDHYNHVREVHENPTDLKPQTPITRSRMLSCSDRQALVKLTSFAILLN